MGGARCAVTWFILCLNFASDCNAGTLLLATDGGIKLLEPETAELRTLHPHPATSVDFRYKQQDLYFISNNQILYSYYSEYTDSYAEPIPIISVDHQSAGTQLADLAVDWRNFKLYYTGGEAGNIYEAALLGATVAPLTRTGAITSDIGLDVYDRKFFCIKDNLLYMSSLESPSLHIMFRFIYAPHLISVVNNIAVDHHNKEVYVVGCSLISHVENQWHLVKTDYNNSYSTLVFNGPELTQPFTLGVYDGVVLWGNLANGNYTIYSCKLTPSCDIDHLEIVYSSREAIHDVKFYNALVQTPDAETACAELACSHNCTVESPYIVSCWCPPGFSIGDEGNVCLEDTAVTSTSFTDACLLKLQELLTSLTDALLNWLSSQAFSLTVLILLASAAILILLFCCLCVLTCVRKPKRSVRLCENYDLSETRQVAGDTSM